MAENGVPYSYTLEYPRGLDIGAQQRGLMKLLRSTLYNVRRHGVFSQPPA
jgi:hypothetical protein